MPEFPLQFGTQSHGGRFGPDTGPRHINAYIEKVTEGEPEFPFVSADGLKSFATVSGGGTCRGMIEAGGNLYEVSNKRVVKVDASGAVTNIGAIPGESGVFMARNAASPFQIAMITEGGKRFVIEDDVLSAITDTDLPPPNSVTFADQRIVYSINDGRIFWSDIDDATSISALSFATAEGAPDGLTRVYFHNLDLWLFGTETTEIWRSTANTDNPFQRVSGGFIQHGCAAHHSVANLGNALFWVDDKDQVVVANGYNPQPVSHLDVSRDIAALENKDAIIGFTYYSDGTGFYVLTCPSWTWVFNINTQRWFERDSLGKTNWRGLYSAHLDNKWIIGDDTASNLYEADAETYDENGSDMVWTIQSPPLHAYPHRVSVDRLYADFVTGVGTLSETDPQVMMKYSDDGGKSWSKELWRDLGADGDYNARVAWNNLGITGRAGRIFELKVSANVARGLRHAAIEGDLVGT